MTAKDKFMSWVRRSSLPYRFKKSIAKRLLPKFTLDYPFETDFFHYLYHGNTADHIDRTVFLCGAYEKYVLYFMRDYIHQTQNQDCVYLDVGANVGNHALFMSRYAKQVIAFEPYDKVRKSLQEKININHIKNISVYPVGLGTKNTRLPFYAPVKGNDGTGSFCKDFKGTRPLLMELELVSGDEYIAQLDIKKIDIIKIDVEGFEKNVLAGINGTLYKYRPLVIFEMSQTTIDSFHDNSGFQDCFPKDYQFYYFSTANKSTGAYALMDYQFGMQLRNQDIVAMPVEKSNVI